MYSQASDDPVTNGVWIVIVVFFVGSALFALVHGFIVNRRIKRQKRKNRKERKKQIANEAVAYAKRAAAPPSAFDENELEITAVGGGLNEVNVRLSGKLQFPLLLPHGTIFVSPGGAIQDMASLRDTLIDGPLPSKQIYVDYVAPVLAACLQMRKPQPSTENELTVMPPSNAALSDDLKLLLAQINTELGTAKVLAKHFVGLGSNKGPEESEADAIPKRVLQFAVWTITDNPAPTSFVRITSRHAQITRALRILRQIQDAEGEDADGLATHEEIQQIKSLFTRAGIECHKYRLFEFQARHAL
jgi:hypothetical protein